MDSVDFVANEIYAPRERTMTFRLLMNGSSAKVKETTINKGGGLFKNILSHFKRMIGKQETVDKVFDREYRTVTLNIVTSPAEKVFEFFKILMEENIDFWETAKKTGLLSEETDARTALSKLYTSALEESVKKAAHSDRMIRHILDDIRLPDGTDFIPHLSIDQRIKIMEANEYVNDMISNAQKKTDKKVEEMEEMVQILQKFLEETKEIQEKDSEGISKKAEQG